jgi:fatty acid desaturase
MAWITPAAGLPVAANSWAATDRVDLATVGVSALIVAWFFALFLVCFGPVLLAMLRHTDRQIGEWVEQDAPRPDDSGQSPPP